MPFTPCKYPKRDEQHKKGLCILQCLLVPCGSQTHDSKQLNMVKYVKRDEWASGGRSMFYRV